MVGPRARLDLRVLKISMIAEKGAAIRREVLLFGRVLRAFSLFAEGQIGRKPVVGLKGGWAAHTVGALEIAEGVAFVITNIIAAALYAIKDCGGALHCVWIPAKFGALRPFAGATGVTGCDIIGADAIATDEEPVGAKLPIGTIAIRGAYLFAKGGRIISVGICFGEAIEVFSAISQFGR